MLTLFPCPGPTEPRRPSCDRYISDHGANEDEELARNVDASRASGKQLRISGKGKKDRSQTPVTNKKKARHESDTHGGSSSEEWVERKKRKSDPNSQDNRAL